MEGRKPLRFTPTGRRIMIGRTIGAHVSEEGSLGLLLDVITSIGYSARESTRKESSKYEKREEC